MAEKCSICGTAMDYVFLEKIAGTYVKNAKGKKRAICSRCQKSASLDALRDRL